MACQIRHRENRSETNASCLPLVEEIFNLVLARPLLDVDSEQVAVCRSVVEGGEHLEQCPLRGAHHVDESFPLILLNGDQEDQAIAALKDAPWVQDATLAPGRDLAAVAPGNKRCLEH